jgi:DNA mismatch endonuclease (patch repair protein)
MAASYDDDVRVLCAPGWGRARRTCELTPLRRRALVCRRLFSSASRAVADCCVHIDPAARWRRSPERAMTLSRSEQMSRVRGKHTEPERLLRAALWAAGMRYRLHARTPVGRPDLVFCGPKVAVFIDGCFWHGCPLHYARPRSREEFWATKLKTNVDRDARQSAALASAGWRVVRLWEHEVVEDLAGCVCRVEGTTKGKSDEWLAQLRVVRVVVTGDRVERRELAQLEAPTVVIKVEEGPRVTAKARRQKAQG